MFEYINCSLDRNVNDLCLKSMKNGLNLAAIAGEKRVPDPERERGGSETFSTFNMNPCFSLTLPGRNPAISLGSDVSVWEGKWMRNTAALWRKSGSFDNMKNAKRERIRERQRSGSQKDIGLEA